MPGPVEDFHYKAFISYSHADKAYADWLHKALETYIVPKRLVGTEGRDGPIPKRLFPIFRDREELPSAHDLSEQISQALETSAYLIVICSLKSAKSRWVNEEILAYKRLGRENQILALIINGTPNATDMGKPKKECFPEALRYAIGPDGNLTKQLREPIAADLRSKADGKEKAALKIIAGLLGVSLDSLAQRDKQRQKARFRNVMTISLSVIALIGAAGGYYWWQQAPHTDYYRTFTTRHGVPEGVARINEIEALQTFEAFAITRRQGRVVEMRFEDSRHVPKAMDQDAVVTDTDMVGAALVKVDYVGDRGFVLTLVNDHNQPMGIKEYTYADQQRSAATVALKSPNGDVRTLETMAASLNGLGKGADKYRSAITQYRLNFDGKGRIATRLYQTAMGDPASDATGSFGTAYDYNGAGQPVKIRNLDAEGHFIPLKSGVSEIRIAYYPSGLVDSVTWLDDGGKPTLNEQGVAVTRAVRDGKGNLTEVGFTGTDGKPALRKDWCASKTTFSYGMRGDRQEQAFFGTDGKAAISCDKGVAGIKWSYDDDGKMLDEAYFGIDGAPILSKDKGVARIVNKYNTAGHKVGEAYFGSDGKPILRKDVDYARVAWVYDAEGHTLEQANFGTDGKPVMSKPAGVARTTRAYDAEGRISRESYFGDDGKPVLNRENGVARIVFGYDRRGNETSEQFFGIDGKPMLSKDWGVAKAVFAYDNRGNKTKIDNFGVDGQPMVSPSLGYSSVTYRYDERGNQVQEAYFDASGKALALKSNVAIVTKAYDEAGNQTEVAFLNTVGKPTPSKELGYSRATWAYDKRGNMIEARYFSADGTPMLNWVGGFARVTRAFDSRGNKIEQAYYGIQGQRIIDWDTNVAKTTWAYDTHGNMIEIDHFGVDLKPAMSWVKGYARATMAYDASGNQTEAKYFGVDGKAIVNPALGYERVSKAFDHRGHLVEEAYFDVDGKPVVNKANGVARITYKYDARGNPTDWAFFGTDGQPAVDKVTGTATYQVIYDALGQIAETKGFNAKGQPVKAHATPPKVGS